MKRYLKVAAIVLFAIAATYLLLPKPDLKNYHGYSRAYHDRNGKLLRLTLADDDRYRIHVTLDQVAPELKAATLLYEDRYYYQHPGIDFGALVRAFWSSYVARERFVGASTITMQVARLRWNLYTRTITGKIGQMLRAIQLTRHYSKDEIFAAYLNLASYGRNIEGIEAASLIYFNKHAADLSLPEALTLSVIPQNPVKRNLTTAAGFASMKVARNRLFARWLDINPSDRDMAMFFDLPLAVRPPDDLVFHAPHFVYELEKRVPYFRRGEIATTLDLDLQRQLEQRLKCYVAKRQTEGITNAALVLLNHQTMEVEAMVGSADFWNEKIEGQVNGTTAKRSPGSALKPLVYALAMDQGLIHPMTLLKDAPRRYAGFTPENFDQTFLGPVFARDALITSRNVPAVELQTMLVKPDLYDLLKTAGVTRLKNADYYGLALTLGGVELTMLEVAKLYAMLANGGEIQSIKMLSGLPDPAGEQEPILSPEASFLTLNILQQNQPPTGLDIAGQVRENPEVAWKTGTSFAFRDAWAVGVTGPYVIAVWVGNFSGEGNPAFVGRQAAGPLLFDIARNLGKGKNWKGTGSLNSVKLNVRKVPVCSTTGDLPGHYCPQDTTSWFIPGVSPIKLSMIHRAVPVTISTGLRACWHQPGKTEMQVYEFWPSDLQKIYRQAGISIKAPPPLEPGCSLDAMSRIGVAPMIESPVAKVEYRLRSTTTGGDSIPFLATTDADVKEVYWFVDNSFVGKVKAGKPFFWSPKSGDYMVRAVDDHGRAARRAIRVGLVSE